MNNCEFFVKIFWLGLLILPVWGQSAESRPFWVFSAREFRLAVQDRGFRRELLSVPKNQWDFWHFAAAWLDENSDLNRMKIARWYYQKRARPQYRLPALMLFYEPWNRPSDVRDQLLMDFLMNHYHEPDVLGLFLYRAQIVIDRYFPQRSMEALTQRLYENPKLHIPELEALLFLDMLLVHEWARSRRGEILHQLRTIWRREILLDTELYNQHRILVQRFVSFYTGYSKNPVLLQKLLQARHSLLCDQGFCGAASLRQSLEKRFTIEKEAFQRPDFLPQKSPQKTSTPPRSPFLTKTNKKN